MLFPFFLVPAVLVGAAADRPPPKAEELAALAEKLRAPVAADRMVAAAALANAPLAGADLYGQRLRRARPVSADTLRKLILEIWAQVPDPNYGKTGNLWLHKPEPPWKPRATKRGEKRARRPPPHDPEVVDWLSALGSLDLDGNPVLGELPDRMEARAEAMEAVALIRALGAAGKAGNTAALEPLFEFAFDLDGVFRDECGRAIRAMESQAIPGLIRRMRAQGKGIALFRMKRYASYQLDRMDRAQPKKAISTAPDDHIRADIIHAYGEVRALDAVDAILGQVDAPSRRVQKEARWAWLRYVTGPAPPEAPKRKRKLPGGKAESEEKEDYLDYRQMAVLALNRELKEIHGDGPCPNCARIEPGGNPGAHADAKKMTVELLAYYDQKRAAEWDAEWNHARGRAQAGDLAGAVTEFGFILARDPLYGRRAEMADTFHAWGAALVERDPEQAAALLREAVALDPASPKATVAEARIHYLDGLERLHRGVPDAEDFRRALALDPSLADARDELRRIEAGGGRRRFVESSALLSMGLGFGALLLSLALFIRRRRPRAAIATPSAGAISGGAAG